MATVDDQRWEKASTELVRLAMLRRGVTHAELARRMTEHGSKVSAASVANRLSRGSFGVAFLLRALSALEIRGAELGRLYEVARPDVPGDV